MTDEMGVGERAERARRRKFWWLVGGVIGGSAIAGMVTGFVGAHRAASGQSPVAVEPVLAYAVAAALIAAFSFGSWLFFRGVDEVEVADNLWSSMAGFYAYAVLLPAWALPSEPGRPWRPGSANSLSKTPSRGESATSPTRG